MKYVYSMPINALLLLLISHSVRAEKLIPAVVNVPVAHVISAPFNFFDSKRLTEAYQRLSPIEPQQDHQHTRRYQLLFNEVVYVRDIKNNQAQIVIPHIMHHHEDTGIAQDFYWVRAEVLTPLHRLCTNGIGISMVPPSIVRGQCEPATILSHTGTIVLAMPWTDTLNGITFSAGTRFVKAANSVQKGQDTVVVYRIDHALGAVVPMRIPAQLTISFCPRPTLQQRLRGFLQLVRSWANIPQGYIPYVWGGASFTHVIAAPDHQPVRESSVTAPIQSKPKTVYGQFSNGFDCSCLISRAALACGLPYYLGNSTSISQFAQALPPGAHISEGDIVWFPGHVLIVSDIEHNLMLEARGYGAGFGRVHELPLNRIFKDVHTYQELQNAYAQNQPLMLLNAQGEDRLLLKEYAIFHFAGSWACRHGASTIAEHRNTWHSCPLIKGG